MEIDKKSQVRDSERKLSFVIRQAVAVSLVCRQTVAHFCRRISCSHVCSPPIGPANPIIFIQFSCDQISHLSGVTCLICVHSKGTTSSIFAICDTRHGVRVSRSCVYRGCLYNVSDVSVMIWRLVPTFTKVDIKNVF